jgi:hypothetical protein
MQLYVAAFCALIWLFSGPQASAQTQRALLIGINTYQPAGTLAQHSPGCTYGRCELGTFENLDGAVNDAQAMADLLTSPKFSFPAENVVLLTNPAPPHPRPGLSILPATQTSRDGILAAMQKYLVDLPHRGDTVVFYAASHGSLRVNSKGTKLTVLVNGKYVHADSTLVPADVYKGGYDVRDREMTRIFGAAVDRGILLTVIFDNCHSGGISRGIGPRYRERSLAFDPRDIAEPPDLLPDGQPRPAPTEGTDHPALVFSAAQQDQTAKEMPLSDPASEPHGAFTAALIEALQALPASTPASVVFQRVRAVLEGGSVPDQEPDLDATPARRRQPLFGGNRAESGKIRAAALNTDDDGSIWLDVGQVSGVGIGSEFTSLVPNAKGETVRLRVIRLEGIARSSAEVMSPSGSRVNPGDVFELAKWMPSISAPLRVWHWPSNLSHDEITEALTSIKVADVTLVADPAEEAWTHVLSWDGKKWILEESGKSAAVSLGEHPAADVLKQHLPSAAKLWVNVPPSRELAEKLLPAGQNSAIQTAADLTSAHYALAGVLTAQGPAYAWFHKSELAAGPPTPERDGHSFGCSSTSQYPVRSDLVMESSEESATRLNNLASLLAKVHGWLELADSPADASAANYYSLVLLPATGEAPIANDQPVHQGDLLRMALQSTARVIEKRWVYILDIDCHGKGTVLYPGNYSENQFPNEADNARQFVLPGARTLRIGPPYGVDTLILLSTAEPLPDPYILNFEGAATRSTRGIDSPLARLLSQTSGGTRGLSNEVPTNWGIAATTIRSIPSDATK